MSDEAAITWLNKRYDHGPCLDERDYLMADMIDAFNAGAALSRPGRLSRRTADDEVTRLKEAEELLKDGICEKAPHIEREWVSKVLTFLHGSDAARFSPIKEDKL